MVRNCKIEIQTTRFCVSILNRNVGGILQNSLIVINSRAKKIVVSKCFVAVGKKRL
jgi:hypothetical protein